jgi:PAS domain-containing protein
MLARLFPPKRSAQCNNSRADLSTIDIGLANLRSTTAEVVRAAAGAAQLLEEEHRRTKACFIALNSASDSICILDHKACIYFCNDQFLLSNGIDRYEDVIGLHILDVLPNIPEFDRVWESCQSNHTEIVQCPTSSMKLTVVPMMNGAPRPIYYICTFKLSDKYKNGE